MSCVHEGLVRLKLVFIFTPRVAGGQEGQFAAECAPLRLEVFGTRELSCRPHQILLRDAGASRVIELEFFAHRSPHALSLPFCNAGVGRAEEYAEANDIGVCAQSSAIVANLYARTWTESGQRIWTSLGGALMPVAVLLNMRRSHKVHRFFQVVLEREIDSPVQPDTPPIKGQIEMMSIEVTGTQLALRSRRIGDVYQSLEQIESSRAQMAAMIQRGQNSFFGPNAYLRPTVPTLQPFHVPTNQTDFMLLPSSSYSMLSPREPLNVAYFEQLVRIALRRSRLSEAEALELARATLDGTGRHADRAAFGAFVVRAMSVFALSQCYMDDISNLNQPGTPWRADLVCSDEDFKLCRLCGGDDCEGCALEPHMHVNQLCASDAATVSQMSVLLRHVRSFLRTFVPCLSLGCVTNKQLTIDRLDQTNSMAHTFAILVPFRLFERMLEPAKRAAIVDGSRFALDRAVDLAAWRGIDQTPLICEGTAPIDPAMRPPAAYYDDDAAAGDVAEQAVAARRRFVDFAIECLKDTRSANRVGLEISGATARGAEGAARDQSTFYKYIVSLATNAFVDRLHCDFVFVYQRDDPQQRTFGIRFADFINGTDAIGLVPYLVYTKEEAAIVDAVLTDQQPIPNLVLPPSYDTSKPPLADSALARIDLLAQQKTFAVPLPGTRLHARHLYATVRLIDLDDGSLRAIETIANGALTRSFSYKIATVSAAIDGTSDHNWIVDFYFTF